MPADLRISPSDSRDEGSLPSVADVPLATARWCARQGWPVHPLAAGRKTPAANCESCRQPGHSHEGCTCPADGRWCHSFHAATLDQRRIDRWWGGNPQFGTGVACGPAGLIVIDIDAHATKPPAATGSCRGSPSAIRSTSPVSPTASTPSPCSRPCATCPARQRTRTRCACGHRPEGSTSGTGQGTTAAGSVPAAPAQGVLWPGR